MPQSKKTPKYKLKYDHIIDGKISQTFDTTKALQKAKKTLKARYPHVKFTVEIPHPRTSTLLDTQKRHGFATAGEEDKFWLPKRTINGENYAFYAGYTSKVEAEALKADFEERGYSVKLIPRKPPKNQFTTGKSQIYGLYKKKKRKAGGDK